MPCPLVRFRLPQRRSAHADFCKNAVIARGHPFCPYPCAKPLSELSPSRTEGMRRGHETQARGNEMQVLLLSPWVTRSFVCPPVSLVLTFGCAVHSEMSIWTPAPLRSERAPILCVSVSAAWENGKAPPSY